VNPSGGFFPATRLRWPGPPAWQKPPCSSWAGPEIIRWRVPVGLCPGALRALRAGPVRDHSGEGGLNHGQTIEKKCGVVATGQTDHRSKRPDVNIVEMINEAVRRCLADANLSLEEIDAVIIGNMEHFEGIYFTEMWSVDGAGAFLKHGMKVTTGGTTGVPWPRRAITTWPPGCSTRS